MLTAKTIVMILLLASSVFAQTQTTGRIAGTVKDPNDALIVGATVTVTSQANGEERTTTTDATGNYDAAFLGSGIYRVRIEANGFSTFNAETVMVSITETTSVNAVLTVAGITVDPITVNNSAPLVKTDSPTLGSTFDSRTITDIPLATRNFTQLLGLTAGASVYLVDNTVVGRNTQNVSINGSRVSQNNFQINGVDANAGISFNRPIPNPAPESIAEFKIQTSLFDATFGRSGGGNVQVVTQSGTNEFHGAIYAYFRNTALTANNPYLKAVGLPRPVLERSVYGGTFGGALRRNRAFFFVSYQGTRDRNGASLLNSLSTNVLIASGLTDDRSEQTLLRTFMPTLPNGQTATAINLTALRLLNARLPNGQFVIPTPQANGRYFGSAISHYREEQFNANFDYRFNGQNLLSAKLFFSDSPETLTRNGNVNVPGFPVENTGENLLVSIQDVHSFNANIINEARIGYNFVRFSNTTQQPLLDSDFGITRSTANAYPGLPIIRIAPNAGGIGFGTFGLSNAHGSIPTAIFGDTLSITRRSHFIRAGLEMRYYGNNLTVPIQTRGNIIFHSFSNFLSGTTQSAALANGITDRSSRTTDYNFFVQDDWKFSPKLTLNLGLRYELDLPPYDTRGRIATFDPLLYRPPLSVSSLPVGGIVQAGNAIAQYDLAEIPNVGKRVLNSIDPNNFAPRLGFAYSPFKKNNVVVRGGYGIFYSRSSFSYINGNILHPPFYFTSTLINTANSVNFGNTFPNSVPSQNQFPLLVPNSLLFGNAFDRDIRTPYIQQFNASVQFGLTADMKLEAAYVGTRGLNLFRQVAINQARLASPQNSIINIVIGQNISTNTPVNAQLRAPLQGVATGSGFILDQTTAQSTYHSMQLSLTRRLSGGLQFLASYTFAKSIDNASGTGGGAGTTGLLNVGQNLDSDVIISNQLDNRANRGVSNFDRTHRFVSSFLWELPKPAFANRSKAGRLLFSNWQMSGIVTAMSGLPIDIIDSMAGTLYLGPSGGARPNFAPGATRATATSNIPSGYYFNPQAFVRPRLTGGQVIPSSGGTAFADTSCSIAAVVCTDFGNVGRNILRGQKQFNFDVSISKRFRFDEAKNIELRAEFFNLFNNVNFANPISNLNAGSDFGKIISTSNNPRLGQLALKYNF